MAHLEGALNGMLMIARAAASGVDAIARPAARGLWGSVVAGWTNIVASTVSAMTRPGTGITGFDWNTFDFLVFMVASTVAAAIALAMAVYGRGGG